MKELSVLSHYIEKFHKTGAKPSVKQLLLLNSGRSDGSPHSPTPFQHSPDTASTSHALSFDEPESDLRKRALRNSMFSKQKGAQEEETGDGAHSPLLAVPRTDSRKIAILNEIKEILAANPPTSWEDLDEFNGESPNKKGNKRVHCYSPVLPHRKPLNKTEYDEQIEAIFNNFTKPKRRDVSLTVEAESRRESNPDYQRDSRLNESCAFEYSTQNCYFKEVKHLRCNSVVQNRVHSNTQAEGPTPKS